MVRIKEIINDDNSVNIAVSGRLDNKSTYIFLEVCQKHIDAYRTIYINFEGLKYMSRSVKDLLIKLNDKLIYNRLPL